MPKVPQIRSLHIFAISPEQKSMGDEVGFLPCVCVARYVKSTQNNKFTISLQYLKENGKNEIDFLTADKLQWFVEIDFIILGVCVARHMPKFPKKISLIFLCNLLRKKLVMKLIFSCR